MGKSWGLMAICWTISFFAAQVWAEEELLSRYKLLAVSAADDRAIVKTPEGDMLTIKAGDIVAPLNISVIQVLADRVVFKEQEGAGDTLMLHKSTGDKSRVQRISSQPDDELVNQTIEITEPKKTDKP